MYGFRRPIRRAARLALVAVALQVLALAGVGAHAHGSADGMMAGVDFCSTISDGDAIRAVPLPPQQEWKVCAHCPGCTGYTGGPPALPAPVAPWLDIEPAPGSIVTAVPPVLVSVDVVTARPRGPPLRT